MRILGPAFKIISYKTKFMLCLRGSKNVREDPKTNPELRKNEEDSQLCDKYG